MAANSGVDKVKKFSALVVDDNVTITNIAQMLLNNHGFNTKAVENGQEAVDIFTGGNTFDTVIMDMEMLIMDGIQAMKQLRAMGVKSLIYGVTAFESKSNIQSFIEAGLDDYFEKPLNVVKVDTILKRLMNM